MSHRGKSPQTPPPPAFPALFQQNGESALSLARQKGHTEVVKLLEKNMVAPSEDEYPD